MNIQTSTSSRFYGCFITFILIRILTNLHYIVGVHRPHVLVSLNWIRVRVLQRYIESDNWETSKIRDASISFFLLFRYR